MASLLVKELTQLLVYIPYIVFNFWWCILKSLVPSRFYVKDVSQDVVLITGAGSGLGRELALRFAKLGASIIAWDINTAALDETRELVCQMHEKWIKKVNNSGSSNKEEENNKEALLRDEKVCLTYLVDVSNRLAVQEAAEQVRQDLNKNRPSDKPKRYISILVNNAGIYHGLLMHELRDEQIERIFKINVLAHFWTVRAFIDDMFQEKRGHIVEIASMAGISGLQKQVDYCASKFATIGFEDALHMELESLGYSRYIKTTVVCPFFFSSNLFTDYKSSLNSLMTSNYVAKETVRATRCNQYMIMLPSRAYFCYLLKALLPRETFILCNKAMGLDDSVRDIKGAAAVISSSG